MPLLASDIMNGARTLLNDPNATNFTNTKILPLLSRANRELEQEIISIGGEAVRQRNAVINVASSTIAINLTPLPSDFLLPLSLFERNQGASNDQWNLMTEKDFEPQNVVPTTSLTYWAFRNNLIYMPGVTQAKEVLLNYERQLAVISGANSPEDFILSQNFLEAKLAELCARFIGMNGEFADDLASREVEPSREALLRLFTLNAQGLPVRRQRFTTKGR